MSFHSLNHIKYYKQNNQKSSTIIFIHGIGIKSLPYKKIFKYLQNHNLIILNIDFDNLPTLSKITNDIKLLKQNETNILKNTYIISHSFGTVINNIIKKHIPIIKSLQVDPITFKSNFNNLLKYHHVNQYFNTTVTLYDVLSFIFIHKNYNNATALVKSQLHKNLITFTTDIIIFSKLDRVIKNTQNSSENNNHTYIEGSHGSYFLENFCEITFKKHIKLLTT